MEYTLRTITADDMFPMFNIISKIGVKEFKGCFESADVKAAIKAAAANKSEDEPEEMDETAVTAVGINIFVDIATIILNNISKCKNDIYQLLSGLSGLDVKEIAALPMNTFIRMIIDVIKKEEFKDFFQDVAKLFN